MPEPSEPTALPMLGKRIDIFNGAEKPGGGGGFRAAVSLRMKIPHVEPAE